MGRLPKIDYGKDSEVRLIMKSLGGRLDKVVDVVLEVVERRRYREASTPQ